MIPRLNKTGSYADASSRFWRLCQLVPWYHRFRQLLLGIGLAMVAPYLAGCSHENVATTTRVYRADLGAIFLEPGKPATWFVQHRFLVRNPFQRSVALRVASVTCGCTSCELATNELAPGEEAEVSMVMYVRYMRESRTEIAWIEMSHPTVGQHLVALELSCEVFPRVLTSQARSPVLFDLSTPFVPMTETVHIFVYGPTGGFMRPIIDIPHREPKYLSISSFRSHEIGGNVVRHEASIKLGLASITDDPLYSDFCARVTYDGNSVEIPFAFRRAPRYRIDPAAVYLSLERRSARVRATALDETSPQLSCVEFPSHLVSVQAHPWRDANAQDFELELTQDILTGVYDGSLVFSSSDNERISVPVYVVGKIR